MLNDYTRLDRRVLAGSQTARSTLYPVILFLGRPLATLALPSLWLDKGKGDSDLINGDGRLGG